METREAVFGRRSVRRFRRERPEADTLREIVRAGAFAASAGNRQPWRFVLVEDPGVVESATDTLAWLAGAPGPDERPTAHVVVLLPKDSGWAQQADAAAACQNMLLAATDKGLGSCWFGSIKRERLAELLAIPDDWHIYSVTALGYPAEKPRVIEGEDTTVKRRADGSLEVPKRPLESVLSVDRFEP